MAKFIARQPILSIQRDVFAYELLFRSRAEFEFRSQVEPFQGCRGNTALGC
jgi:c-di-GMP-related signal transduction protein